MSDRAIDWAIPYLKRMRVDYTGIALLVLAGAADEDGAIARQDFGALGEGAGIKANWFLGAVDYISECGLITPKLRYPRDAETLHMIGPIRLRLERPSDDLD